MTDKSESPHLDLSTFVAKMKPGNNMSFLKTGEVKSIMIQQEPTPANPTPDENVRYTVRFHTNGSKYNVAKIDVNKQVIDVYHLPGFIPRVADAVEPNDDGSYTVEVAAQATVTIMKAVQGYQDDEGFIPFRALGAEFAVLNSPSAKAFRDQPIGHAGCKWHLPMGTMETQFDVVSQDDPHLPNDYKWANVPFRGVACTHPNVVPEGHEVGLCNFVSHQPQCNFFETEVIQRVEIKHKDETSTEGNLIRTLNPIEGTTHVEVFTDDAERVVDADYTPIEEETVDAGNEERISPLRLIKV